MIAHAVILAAGMGTRLAPLTSSCPKCLVKVNGRAILENTLKHLAGQGIREVVILVGYREGLIRSRIGRRYLGMKIRYVRNPIFHQTNNMYSLWLARRFCPADRGMLLVEGDLFFEKRVLGRLLSDPAPCCWAADEFIRFKEGCMLSTDSSGSVRRIEIIRRTLPSYHDRQHKSAGMVKLNRAGLSALWDCLEFEVRHWHLGLYYDQVFSRHLGEFGLKICSIAGLKWMEIDDYGDLKKAQALFPAGTSLPSPVPAVNPA